MCAEPRPNGFPSRRGNWRVEVRAPDWSPAKGGTLRRAPSCFFGGAGNAGVPPMRNNWLGTAAIALVIGTGSAFAQQSDLPQKRDEAGSRTSVPSKDAERPAAHEQRSPGVSNDRAAQREPGAAAEPRRGEMTPQREQAQEQQLRGRQPTRQSEGQMGRERPTVGEAQQLQNQRSGRDHEQATE